MRRTIVYPGELPRSADFLLAQQSTMIALGSFMSTVLGLNTQVDGLGCIPTVPATLSVIIQRGNISQLSLLEGTAYGSLPADTTNSTIKLGIQIGNKTLGPIAAPTTPGQSQVWLVQAQFLELDDPTSLMVLPYYNAANPQQGYSGPGNNGTSQYTVRDQQVSLFLKPGIPATSGTQVSPTADVGWVPMHLITLSYGQTQIVSANIVQSASSPRIPFNLSQLTPGFSRRVNWTSPGTVPFVVPFGVTLGRVTVRGAGGGGGGSSGAANSAGAGGGGSGYSEGFVTLIPGATISVTVGAGGAGGTTAGTGGVPGGSSSFGTFMSATGGGAGGGGISGLSVSSGAPGAGSGGNLNMGGTPGEFAFPIGAAGSPALFSGMGGSSVGYVQAGASSSITTIPSVGRGGLYFGAGGWGGLYGAAGGAGASGFITLEY